jgi:hypothetical protein
MALALLSWCVFDDVQRVQIVKKVPAAGFEWCSALEERKGTLEARALQDVCAMHLAGGRALTNNDGVATFDSMHLASGFPAALKLAFELDWCEDKGCKERAPELKLKGKQDEKRVEIVAYTDLTVMGSPLSVRSINTAPSFMYLGVPVADGGAGSSGAGGQVMVPEAIVIDALGSPVANVSVVIFAPDKMAQVMSQNMFSRRGSAAKSAGQKVRLVSVCLYFVRSHACVSVSGHTYITCCSHVHTKTKFELF